MVKSDKRTDIMQAALELIVERGFHDAPMSEIAGKAQVAAGTIYRYFENKDILINELFHEIEDRLLQAILTDYPVGKMIQEQFFHLFGQLFRYLLMHPGHFRYMEQYFNSPYGISHRRDKLVGKNTQHGGHDTLIGLFEEGIAQNILKDMPIIVLTSLAIGPMLYTIRDHTLGFVSLDDPLIRRITEACWDAIKR